MLEAQTVAAIFLGVFALIASVVAILLGRGRNEARAAAAQARELLRDQERDVGLARQSVGTLELASARTQDELARERERAISAEVRRAASDARLAEIEPQAVERAQLATRVVELVAENAQMRTRVEESTREIARMQGWVSTSTDTLKAQMAEISARVIRDSTANFRAESKEQLELLLKPFDKDLLAFRSRIEQLYLDETKERNSLQGEVRRLAESSLRVSQDAQNLATALRGDSRARGHWGEVILARVLEMSGLRENHEFFLQHHLQDEDGERGRLDVLVKLPQDRCIVIDSKVSLVDWDRYVNCADDEDEKVPLRAHIASVRRHIHELSGKDYAGRVGAEAIQYVLMFVPIEPALMAALQHDTGLAEYAHGKNIALVSPNTLSSMLKTIDYLWQVEKRTRNSEDIAQRAGRLIDAIVGANEVVGKLEGQMKTARKTLGTLSTKFNGQRGLLQQTRAIQDLGARGQRSVPKSIGEDPHLDDAEDAAPDTGAESDEPSGMRALEQPES